MKLFSRTSGQGKPLIILHGLFGMSDNWNSLARQFSENDFHVFALDLRNHGQSFHSDVFNYDAMSEDVIQFISSEGLEKVNIIGHSMGGKVAMLLACLNENLIEKLIVADIAPRYYPPHHQDVLAAIHAVKLSECKTRNDAEEMMLPFENSSGVRQFLLKNLFWKEERGEKKLSWRFNLSAIEENIENVGEALPALATFSHPTLFLRGEKSNYISDNDSEDIVSHFPNSEIETIKNAGHWLHADQPSDFFKSCLIFLNK